MCKCQTSQPNRIKTQKFLNFLKLADFRFKIKSFDISLCTKVMPVDYGTYWIFLHLPHAQASIQFHFQSPI